MSLEDKYIERISEDWLWRERELRDIDRALTRSRREEMVVKSAILLTYSHWEGHFKASAEAALSYMEEGVRRKAFLWTDFKCDVRERLLFCCYRRASIAGQSRDTFIRYLNALSNARFSEIVTARPEIIMIDDNLNTARAEAICRNFGMNPSWFLLKKIIIDERILEHRNAIAHGSTKLRGGDFIDIHDESLLEGIRELREIIRLTKNAFSNCVSLREFLDL